MIHDSILWEHVKTSLKVFWREENPPLRGGALQSDKLGRVHKRLVVPNAVTCKSNFKAIFELCSDKKSGSFGIPRYMLAHSFFLTALGCERGCGLGFCRWGNQHRKVSFGQKIRQTLRIRSRVLASPISNCCHRVTITHPEVFGFFWGQRETVGSSRMILAPEVKEKEVRRERALRDPPKFG